MALHTEAGLVLLAVQAPAAQRGAATLEAARPGLLPVAHSTNSESRLGGRVRRGLLNFLGVLSQYFWSRS